MKFKTNTNEVLDDKICERSQIWKRGSADDRVRIILAIKEARRRALEAERAGSLSVSGTDLRNISHNLHKKTSAEVA